MPEITAITAQIKHKDRCNLFIDGEFYAGVSLETVMKNRLKVGQKIEDNTLADMIKESEKSQAIAKAVDYVSNTLKTKKQVREYLIKKGFEQDAIKYAVDKLIEYGYIDDGEYSKRYIESTGKTQGKHLLAYKLMSKGVRKDIIEQAYEVAENNSQQNAILLAEKKLKNKEITKENISKTYRYLVSRGFSYEEAEQAIAPFKELTEE